MANTMMVDTGGYLLFNNVMFSDLANTTGYTYSASQPYINRGVGYGLWPTIALAPKALVSWCLDSTGAPVGTWHGGWGICMVLKQKGLYTFPT